MATKRKLNNRNPRNAESTLFRALTRLLSGPIVNYRTQNPQQLRRNQLDKYKFKSAGGLAFRKSTSSPFEQLYAATQANQARAERYIDFDQMEYIPEIASALDIYADEMTTSSPMKPILEIVCENDEIREVLRNLFYDIMNIEGNLFGWCRTMCKYGDFFLYLDIDEKVGIKFFIGIPAQEIERLEGTDKTNPQYVQFQWNSGGLTFENWQIAHFRIADQKFAPYGTSVLDPARRISRQLQLQEDAMMAYRIVRSPERRLFKIDVGGIPEKEVEQFMEQTITKMKKNQIIDSDTGRVDLRYNPMSVDEDYFIAVRGDRSGTDISTLPGGAYTGDIDDVIYLQNKLLAAIKIPRSYLIEYINSTASDDKATLAQKDVHFARTINRLQRSVISELQKIAVVHLYTLGYRGKDLLCFKLQLNNPSKISELQELEHFKTKLDVAEAAKNFYSTAWIYKKVFGESESEIIKITRERIYDAKFTAILTKLIEGDVSGEDGGLGDLDAGDMEDIGDSADDTDSEEDQTLLAAPDDSGGGLAQEAHTTPGSKGKVYKPKAADSRTIGARRRHNRGQYSDETGRATDRNIWKGMADLKSLASGILESRQEEASNYDNKSEKFEENEILKNDREIKLMLERLEMHFSKEEEKIDE